MMMTTTAQDIVGNMLEKRKKRVLTYRVYTQGAIRMGRGMGEYRQDMFLSLSPADKHHGSIFPGGQLKHTCMLPLFPAHSSTNVTQQFVFSFALSQ